MFYQGTVEATSVLYVEFYNSTTLLATEYLPNKYLLKQYRQVNLEYYQVQCSPKILYLSLLFLCVQKKCSHFNHRNSERQLITSFEQVSS